MFSNLRWAKSSHLLGSIRFKAPLAYQCNASSLAFSSLRVGHHRHLVTCHPMKQANVERPLVLGIESSFDDTAISLVDANGKIISDVRLNQRGRHGETGGIVPQVAGSVHREHLPVVLSNVMRAAKQHGLGCSDVDYVACTVGPGLAPCLQAGLDFAKELAVEWDRPLIPVHHMEAHALTPRIDSQVDFPFLVLLASGGHCLLLLVEGIGRIKRLGTTQDDAPGEAYDKVARALGLEGGRELEECASSGDPSIDFTVPLQHQRTCMFSFSGLKSSALRAISQHCEKQTGKSVPHGDWRATCQIMQRPENVKFRSDLAASFQSVVCRHIQDRIQRSLLYLGCSLNGSSQQALRELCQYNGPPPTTLVLSGGVACNGALRQAATKLASVYGLTVHSPEPYMCLDNGVMIAWTGVEYALLGRNIVQPASVHELRYTPKWPLGTDIMHEVKNADIKLESLKGKSVYD